MSDKQKFTGIHCPKCLGKVECGCKACVKRHGKNENMFISNDAIDTCPHCGYSAHVDQWLDIEYAQLRR